MPNDRAQDGFGRLRQLEFREDLTARRRGVVAFREFCSCYLRGSPTPKLVRFDVPFDHRSGSTSGWPLSSANQSIPFAPANTEMTVVAQNARSQPLRLKMGTARPMPWDVP